MISTSGRIGILSCFMASQGDDTGSGVHRNPATPPRPDKILTPPLQGDRWNRKAVASLILGIVGLWPIFGVLAGIPALFLARKAKDAIALSEDKERGWRLAQTARVRLGVGGGGSHPRDRADPLRRRLQL